MTTVGFSLPAVTSAVSEGPGKAASAAKDFEGLLIAQMLQSIREQGSGWLGGGDDDASATAFGLGEQYLAGAIAAGGGLGLGKIIERSLTQTRAEVGTAPAGSARAQTVATPGRPPKASLVQR